MADIPPPPAGFALDSAPSAAAPPPPPGFALDQPEAKPPGLLARIGSAVGRDLVGPAAESWQSLKDNAGTLTSPARDKLPKEATFWDRIGADLGDMVKQAHVPLDLVGLAASPLTGAYRATVGRAAKQLPMYEGPEGSKQAEASTETALMGMASLRGLRMPPRAAGPADISRESMGSPAAESPAAGPAVPEPPAGFKVDQPVGAPAAPRAAAAERPPERATAAPPPPEGFTVDAPPRAADGKPPADVMPPPSKAAAAYTAIREKARTALEVGSDLWSESKKAVAPMAVGSPEARAVAKDFANDMRLARYEGTRAIEAMTKDFTPEQLRAMWQAADADSVAIQRGGPPNARAMLEPKLRGQVETLQADAQAAWEAAKATGMVHGEGLPSYTPRMIVDLAGDLSGESGAGRGLDRRGGNLTTTTPGLKNRKHLTVEETQAAARQSLEAPGAEVVQDIRTLALATQRLKQAVAGRELVNQIKAAGQRAGENVVMEGAKPNEPGWFTIDHPALTTWRPKFETVEGKTAVLKDANGNPVMEKVPLYIRGDFEGPLRAVLSQDTGKVYNAMMELKGKTMSVIMYSPLIHNAVEWGRALPAMPGKVATFKIYFEGNAAKNDPAVMREAIKAGVVPIGNRGGMQDITSIAEGPQIKPGRSWTAQLVGAIPGLFDKNAGQATMRAIDRMGDVWHNTLLWDRIGDLQMGLYTNLRDKYIAKGHDPQTSQRLAAHLANRYAGALPIEAMSTGARKLANLTMFSRSFTLGNLGAMKDMVKGLPLDVQAQIARDSGIQALDKIKPEAQRKAVAIIALDIALMYIANSALQSGIAVLSGDKTIGEEGQGYMRRLNREMQRVKEDPSRLLNPFGVVGSMTPLAENEPGKKERVLIGRADDGTAIYMRNPTGKIGEEFYGWATNPLDMMQRKMSTFARPVMESVMNRDSFGHRIYDPYADTPKGYIQNVAKLVGHVLGQQIPLQAIRAARDQFEGRGDSTVNMLQILGPLAGLTFSKGMPGGPEVGQLYRAREEHDTAVREAMPAIRDKIKAGDIDGARADMTKLNVPGRLQSYYVLTTQNPNRRLTPGQMRNFEQYASPEQKEDMTRFREQGRSRVAAPQ